LRALVKRRLAKSDARESNAVCPHPK
jgi:hypothetical protein